MHIHFKSLCHAHDNYENTETKENRCAIEYEIKNTRKQNLQKFRFYFGIANDFSSSSIHIGLYARLEWYAVYTCRDLR